MTNPEIQKKASTPKYPFLKLSGNACPAITANTAMPRKNCISGLCKIVLFIDQIYILNAIILFTTIGGRMLVNNIEGFQILPNKSFQDSRGNFCKIISDKNILDFNLDQGIREVSFSENVHRWTFRGFHGMPEQICEYKFVSCISGAVQDYVIDYREKSKTFLDYISITLDSRNLKTLLIPPGCLHGFLTLEKNSTLIYAMTSKYNEAKEIKVKYDDPKINVKLPSPIKVISLKDQSIKFLS